VRVNLSLELTDHDRRTVRATIGRGGVATRKEIRIFAERAIRGAIAAAPEPKRSRRKALEVEPVVDGRYLGSHVWDPSPEALARVARLAARKELELRQQAASDDTICELCRRRKDEHGKMGLTCPPQSRRPRGERFTPVAVS